MNELTEAQLRAMLTSADADARVARWLAPINDAMRACGIATPARQAVFLAQVMLESSELRLTEEALNYSPARLCQVWPLHFPSEAAADAYGHNPEGLANRVYAKRMGNGDEGSGDGWAYRGRGLIQLTGRDNYAGFSRAMGIDAVSDPDLLQHPAGAVLSAGWFWQSKGLNELADKTASAGEDADAAFAEITRHINGGLNGLAQRRGYWTRTRQALGLAV